MKKFVLIPMIAISLLLFKTEILAQTDPQAEKLYKALLTDDCLNAKLLAPSVTNVNYTKNGISLLTQCYHCPDVARILLEKGAEVNLKNSDGKTALHTAALGGNLDLIKLLLSKGANINICDTTGETPLFSAAWWGSSDGLKILLNNGANPNIQNNKGSTPLHSAASNVDIDKVKILLDAGANPNLPDKYGYNALNIASIRGYKDIVDLLVAKGATDGSVNIKGNVNKNQNNTRSYDSNWDGYSWFDRYTKSEAMYEGDSEELICNLSNKIYRQEFAKNIKKIILCHYAVDPNDKYDAEAKYYRSIINEARNNLIKKGYEVEIVWYDSNNLQYSNSETIKNKPARGEVAIVKITAGYDFSNRKYSSTTNETVGVVKDASGKTIVEYQAPSTSSYRENYYTTVVNMWVWPYYQKQSVEGFLYRYTNTRDYNFLFGIRVLLKDIPKRIK